MRRSITAILLGCAFSISAITPAFAEDAPAAKPAPKPASGGGKLHAVAGFPVVAASFLTGMLVGTPVAIVRAGHREYMSATKDLVGESSNPVLWAAATPLGLVGGGLSGVLYGGLYGVSNSAKNAVDDPFSKDSMSLGEDLH